VFVLNLNMEVTPAPGPQSVRPQAAGPAAVNKTVVSNGTILLNGRLFPMVLDAGTDCFTPHDYDLVMSSKDAYGANTWWLQYAMRTMTSETEGGGDEDTVDCYVSLRLTMLALIRPNAFLAALQFLFFSPPYICDVHPM
jgi:hypothetical protein